MEQEVLDFSLNSQWFINFFFFLCLCILKSKMKSNKTVRNTEKEKWL